MFFYVSDIKIPDNPNLKISINLMEAPVVIETYYFYDKTIIQTRYTGGVIPTGTSSSLSTTKYFFNKEIDLSELRNFLNKFEEDTSNEKIVEITEKDGKTYSIDLSITNEDNSVLRYIPLDISTEIHKITDNAMFKQER